MMKTFAVAAALAGGALIGAPAGAAPLAAAAVSAPATAAGGQSLVENVQYYYGPRYGYYRGPSRGAAVGAGIAAGVIGGALAAGALAGPRYVAPPTVYVEPGPVYPAPVYVSPTPRAYGYSAEDVDAVAYCSRRFRTYNPETGTYIAANGTVRACP